MTGKEFERLFCRVLQNCGYWAVNIPPNEWGAQPFDVLAIHGSYMLAADCKVCSASASFPMERVEDNQWMAFEVMNRRTNADIGLAIYVAEKGEVRWVSYNTLKCARDSDVKSIKISNMSVMYSAEEIAKLIGGHKEG